jgi:hypothetical protein
MSSNLKEAIQWYTMSADKNDERSQIALVRLYMSERNYAEAFKWAKTSERSPISCFLLGNMYYQGLGVEANVEHAWHYYKLSAKGDMVYAQMIFNKFYLTKQWDCANEISDIVGSSTVPRIIHQFTQHLVNYVWNNLANNPLLTGLSLNKSAPIITYSDKAPHDTMGQYVHPWHRIFINQSYFDPTPLEHEISTYVGDPKTLENLTVLNRLIGITPRATTLVHEMGHAFRCRNHTGPDAHGIYTFRYDNTDYALNYDEGCNFLWTLGIMGYLPLR